MSARAGPGPSEFEAEDVADHLTTLPSPHLSPTSSYLNSSAPFNINEYDAVWNRAPYGPWNLTEYPDFKFNNKKNDTCQLPIFWDTSGKIVNVDKGPGCYDSPFDQYGDMEAFGVQ